MASLQCGLECGSEGYWFVKMPFHKNCRNEVFLLCEQVCELQDFSFHWTFYHIVCIDVFFPLNEFFCALLMCLIEWSSSDIWGSCMTFQSVDSFVHIKAFMGRKLNITYITDKLIFLQGRRIYHPFMFFSEDLMCFEKSVEVGKQTLHSSHLWGRLFL